MKENKPDWDPRSEDVLRDQVAAYDAMRERCPVAHIIQNPEAFSNAVSQHLSVPSGMDPPEHTVYRRLIDPHFAPERMDACEPLCRQIAADLVREVLARGEVEIMADMAVPFAVRAQCAFLGWPVHSQEALANWTRRNYEATLAQDREAMSGIAREFEGFIDAMIEERLQTEAGPEKDVTASLMHEEVWERPLSNEEISSILRIWTVGEIGSIASSVGILVHYLAEHPDLQNQLRSEDSLLPAAIDEILRIHGPLVASRRITKCAVEIGGRQLDAGERLSLNWVSANRDGQVFEEPERFRLDRDPMKNLLYGAGIHICPGAPLARMEMRVALEELLASTTDIQLIPDKPPTRAVYPASGFAAVAVRIQ